MGTASTGGGFDEPIVAPNLITAVYFDGITQSPSATASIQILGY